jgi:ribosomal protein L40E
MQFLRGLFARLRAWKMGKFSPRSVVPIAPYDFGISMASIRREVTPNGVRVFSLCGSCGATLHSSATLCDECAQKRSRPARPF